MIKFKLTGVCQLMNESDLEFYAAKLKESNIKLTPQRLAIIKELLSEESPVTSDYLHRKILIDFPTITQATIDNNMKIYEQCNVVKKVKTNSRTFKYEMTQLPFYKCEVSCIRCGIYLDFSDKGKGLINYFDDILTGFNPLNLNLKIQGLCAECEEKKII